MWVQFLISGGAGSKSNLATGRGILGINRCHRCRPGMQGVREASPTQVRGRVFQGLRRTGGAVLEYRGCKKPPH